MKIERGYAQHVGSRNEQQDAGMVLSDESHGEQLVVIADGMGGHAGGSLASGQVAETARRLWAEHQKSPIEPKRLLERIVREGHEAINRAGAEKGLTPRSTCALLFLRNGERGHDAHWAHIGDSRIYRLRDGQVARLTRDHSVVQMLVDLGKVSEEEMGTHPDQNRLTQSLGGDAQPMPDFGNDGVKPHDAFLVCSDGLWEMIPQSEMAAALAARRLGDDGAKHLVERAFDRAKPKSDNITVALLRIDGPPPAVIAADPEDQKTTRLPHAPPLKRAAGGAKWGFIAATVIALGAAAAVVYKPWDKAGLDTRTTPVVGPKEKPPEKETTPPVERTEPPKPDPVKPDPADRREGPTPPPTAPTPPQGTPEQLPPNREPPAPGPTQPGPSPAQPERGAVPPPPQPDGTGGEAERRHGQKPAPARPAHPAQPVQPRQSGLGPDQKQPPETPPNVEKPPEKPPEKQPETPGPAPEKQQ